MKKKRPIHHYFFSHEGNGHSPRLLAEASVLILALITVGVFSLTSFEKTLIGTNTNLAAVYSDTLVSLANQDRAASDLPALQPNAQLTAAAEAKANDMVTKGYFAHYSPTGVSPWYWITEAGYNFVYAGENLAINFTDSDAVNSAWLASPEHRANILNVHYTQIGIATAEGMYQGQETTFVVQMFGSPVGGAVADNSSAAPFVPTTASAPAAPAAATTPAVNQAAPAVAGASASAQQASPKVPKVEPIAGSGGPNTPATVPIAVENVSAVPGSASSVPASAVLGAAAARPQVPPIPAAPTVVLPQQPSAQASQAINPVIAAATNPTNIADFLYLVLALLVLIPFLSIIISGVRAHNIKQLFYASGLVALIAVLCIFSIHLGSTVTIL